MVLINLNHMVATLAVCLALSSYLVLKRYGFPEKIAIGSGILCILLVAMFWTSVLLGTGDDDDN